MSRIRRLEAQLEAAKQALRVAENEIGKRDDTIAFERAQRVSAQRGLVENYQAANGFAEELRAQGHGALAERMHDVGLDRRIGYDPDKDPLIRQQIREGTIGALS